MSVSSLKKDILLHPCTHWGRWARASELPFSFLWDCSWLHSSSTSRLTEATFRYSEAAKSPWCLWSEPVALSPHGAPSLWWQVCRSSVPGCLFLKRTVIWWGVWGLGMTAWPGNMEAGCSSRKSDTYCHLRRACCTSCRQTGRQSAEEAAGGKYSSGVCRQKNLRVTESLSFSYLCCFDLWRKTTNILQRFPLLLDTTFDAQTFLTWKKQYELIHLTITHPIFRDIVEVKCTWDLWTGEEDAVQFCILLCVGEVISAGERRRHDLMRDGACENTLYCDI